MYVSDSSHSHRPRSCFRFVLADFGLAAELKPNCETFNDFPGSPNYACPQIMQGLTYLGRPADVWACGATLFELLVGKPPFDSDTFWRIRERVINEQVVFDYEPSSSPGLAKSPRLRSAADPASRSKSIPEPVQELLLCMLEKNEQLRIDLHLLQRRVAKLLEPTVFPELDEDGALVSSSGGGSRGRSAVKCCD
jgi:serine/threonine protein kinase